MKIHESVVANQPGRPVSARCVLEGCRDFNECDVTRFEVIDDSGRVYSIRSCAIELSYQDGGRTLKVFVKKKA